MEQNGKKQDMDIFTQSCQKILASILALEVLNVLLIFPLYYRDYYYDILEAKYQYYYRSMLLAIVSVVLIVIIFLVIDILEFRLWHTKEFLGKFSVKEIRKTLTSADWWLLVFLAVCIISTVQSDYVYESFWGNEGRYTGLFLHLIYVAGFFLVSRLYCFKKWHIAAFLAVAMLPLLFGITDYFAMDLLGFKEEIAEVDSYRFISTFGNVNTYVTFLGIIFGCIGTLFAIEPKGWKALLYFIGYMVSVVAIIMASSDNVVFALGVFFGFLPLVLFRSRRGIERYFLLLAGFFAGVKVVSVIAVSMNGQVLPISGFFDILIHIPMLFTISAVCFAVGAGIYLLRRRDKTGQKEDLGKRYVRLWGILLVLCVGAGLYMIYDVNWGEQSERYGSLKSFLEFTDEWGTYRGLAWRIAMESYQKQPLSHKLWGYGLDTFGLLTYSYRGETDRIFGQVFDSAHNEYLQYLVTIGPLGLLSYLGFLVSSLKQMFRNKWGTAVAFGVLCYLVQAFLTINLPIVTPIMWMLLAVGVAACRDVSEKNG